MNNEARVKVLNILRNEVVPATGCTEPVAVALACAKAIEIFGKDYFEKATVLVSPNIFKNGLCVGIPNCDRTGLDFAAALGFSIGNSKNDLRILENISKEIKLNAEKLLDSKKISLSIADVSEKVYVSVEIKSQNKYAKAIIKNKHNNFVYLESTGKTLLNKNNEKNDDICSDEAIYEMKIIDLIKEIEKIEYSELEFLLKGIEMNEQVAKLALDKKIGIGVGFGIKENINKGILSNDLLNNAMMLTAAASDARMSGMDMPVMSSNGSGNHGLTAILPIAAYKNLNPNVTNEKLATALAISHIITGYIKHYTGRLTPLCGCGVAAGVGASVGLAWLLGANYNQLEGVINNMIANTAGMICDGAKVGCALKLATAASASVQSAILAKEDMIVPQLNGIVGHTVEESIRNIGKLSIAGMALTDKLILNMMNDMQKSI